MDIEIIKTEDGSDSLFVKELNEVYHSKYGAITESEHVFINAGLNKVINWKDEINILEVGFGTGLNAFLTYLKCTEKGIIANYHGIEPYPLANELYAELNYPKMSGNIESGKLFLLMHRSNWGDQVNIGSNFILTKIEKKIQDVYLKDSFYNLVYFDAFAPEVDPELWDMDIFDRIYKSMREDGIFVTYSAKGSVRRNLQNIGFEVERIPGPKGKREMIRAIKK